MKNTIDSLLYGVCYYPEHWPLKTQDDDLARIADCGMNVIRLGEGAWWYWEPTEGRYQFDLFDRVIDRCKSLGLRVILGTPTYTAPAWVSHNYPEVLRHDFRRLPIKHGGRRQYTYNSPKYLELSDRLCTELARHYKDESAVIAWQLDNEFNNAMDVSYAPCDTRAFAAWCRAKYASLEALNEAWGTTFWSQVYDDWEQIDLPHPTVPYNNPHQLLDETRFISDSVVAFARRQAAILRAANRRWAITHNALFWNVDGPELAGVLDYFCHDQYPPFYRDWHAASFKLIEARGLSFPFGVMEQQSGPGGQQQYFLRTPRPGQQRLWAWQAVAHGAKLISYFTWRTLPYGTEQHWHGLLDHDGKDNRRVAEARQTGDELRSLPDDFWDAVPLKQVAILRDFDNETNDRRINTYNKTGQWEIGRWMAAAGREHVGVDFVWTGDALGAALGLPDASARRAPAARRNKNNSAGQSSTALAAGDAGEPAAPHYRVLIAPHQKITDAQLVRQLTAYVRAGGVLVLGAQSGLKDRNLHIVQQTPPGPLARLAGVEVEDFSTCVDDEAHAVITDDHAGFALNTFVERLTLRGARAIGRWAGDDPLLAGAPAVTEHRVGAGRVIYIGGYAPDDAVAVLLRRLLGELAIEPPVRAPAQVEVLHRRSRRGDYLVLLNHSGDPQWVEGLTGWTPADSDGVWGAPVVVGLGGKATSARPTHFDVSRVPALRAGQSDDRCKLTPYGVRVLSRNRPKPRGQQANSNPANGP